ncbi:3-mercaptopropionate dioxygenase [Alphaproteobacteria bacterium SO-S41]|nr:3-mercaptopropionate dioxygenase [Alphaproteobacteria bacterium SO-S41]
MPPRRLDRLRDFVGDIAALVERTDDEAALLGEGGALLKTLVAEDDWLPDAFAVPDPQRYRQYLLHCDGRERFSVVSFVWGPGQATPIHNHTVWGLVGILRGAEFSQPYRQGDLGFGPAGEPHRLEAGDVEAIAPSVGDIHRVSNAYPDRASVSIHVYGANIGAVRRSTFAEDGTPKTFISGYNNSVIPNLWDRSAATA